MRFANNGWFVVACLLVAVMIQSATTGQAPNQAFSPPIDETVGTDLSAARQSTRPSQLTASASSDGIMAFAAMTPDGGQRVTVIDAQQRWMAVYSVDVGGGRIKLLSSRPLKQDFSIEFNAAEPTSADIQKLQIP